MSESDVSASPSLPQTSSVVVSQPLLGSQFEPALLKAVELEDLHWFRTDWQRGGAATGYARLTDQAGDTHDVVVKLPVKPVERLWLQRLQEHPDTAPRLFAHGETLGGYDIAWVVMEKLEHGPLGKTWRGAAFDLTVEAAGRFYAAARDYPVDRDPPKKDWRRILDLARQKVRRHSVADEQRWNKALKKAGRKLDGWLSIWRDRPIRDWCHGDLHLGNAMSRTPAPGGPAVLIDYAEAHAGNWVEDAIYFEHLYWSRRNMLQGRKIGSALAHQRKEHGLEVEADWPKLASVRRALLAMSTPAMLEHDGVLPHVAASLDVLERESG